MSEQENPVVTIQQFMADSSARTEQELSVILGVAQSTVHRWLQRADIYVELNSQDRWETVFKETVLKERRVRKPKR